MHLFQRERRAVEGADHCAAALGAQVEGEESEGSHASLSLTGYERGRRPTPVPVCSWWSRTSRRRVSNLSNGGERI